MSRMAGPVSTPKSDADWNAKCDADILVQASEIMGDEKRFKAAKKWVSVRVIEAQEHLKSALKVEGEIKKGK